MRDEPIIFVIFMKRCESSIQALQATFFPHYFPDRHSLNIHI